MGERCSGEMPSFSSLRFEAAASMRGYERALMQNQRLRYKDYHLASRPGTILRESTSRIHNSEPGFFETESVKDFAISMEQRGVLSWWRRAMGYERSDDSV